MGESMSHNSLKYPTQIKFSSSKYSGYTKRGPHPHIPPFRAISCGNNISGGVWGVPRGKFSAGIAQIGARYLMLKSAMMKRGRKISGAFARINPEADLFAAISSTNETEFSGGWGDGECLSI